MCFRSAEQGLVRDNFESFLERLDFLGVQLPPPVWLSAIVEDYDNADAWYSVEVVGSGTMAPAVLGGSPYAVTNPIEVDADGDGVWTPPAKQ